MGFLGYYVRFKKRKVKRTKLCRRSLAPVCRINDLSDELLIKILSFLPTKAAVSTSILSKQWRFLWMWLPKLEYSNRGGGRCYCSNSSAALGEFIDKNLPLHRAPVIERFSLDLLLRHTQPEDIKRWLEVAVSRSLRDLDINYYSQGHNILPSSFYTCCNSLVILKLCCIALVDVPSTARFPSLKTLRLQYLTYQHDDSLQGLLDACPVLEDLSVRFGGEQSMGEVTFIVPNLQRLSIFMAEDGEFDGYVIDTPSLKYFKLEDWSYMRHDVEIKDMPKLEEAYVGLVSSVVLKSVIGSITSVKHLTICSEMPKSERLDIVYRGGFVFNQLTHLKQCLCKKNSSHLLSQLLKDSPNLRVLDISHMEGHGSDERNEMVCWDQPSPVPECLLSSLQILNWSRYFGRPQDIDIAVYILKHARCLEKAKIIADTREHDVQNLEMITELAFSSRASSRCELVFVKGPPIWKDKYDQYVV
ncbi:F-box domain-containing protein [Hirschfeldia incana]|nr:F-box domain-containing protein [Hirschfeldia incana]